MVKDTNEEILHTLADMNEAIGGRFDRVDGKFIEIDSRFDRVDTRLTDMQTQLNRIETIVLQDHARRIEALERKVSLT